MALLLSFAAFNFGGSLVTSMFHTLKVGMGYSAYLLPLIFGSLAWMLFQPTKYAVNGLNYIGFMGLVSSMAALFHIGLNSADGQIAAQNGYGGGYLGLSISNWMLGVLNVVAASIVLIALMAIFLILATNTNLKELFGAIFAGFTREGKPADETAPEIRPEMEQLKVNDNSGLAYHGVADAGGSKRW